jgi:hypothetical protein
VDGATVPLVGGTWAEVKTLALGEVLPAVEIKGERVIRTDKLSYFSRMVDSDTFQRLALVETYRRGVETDDQVTAVTDGSYWIQGVVDFHRPDAIRILDFPHAGGHLSAVGQTVFGEGSTEAQTWLATQMHQLKHVGPASILTEVRQLVATHSDQANLGKELAYLEKREALMHYPEFQDAGWPIGDGAVESASKLVVEARLKGSGVHWAPDHVDPMVALRNVACNDRWDKAWPQIAGILHQQEQKQRAERRHQRHQPVVQPPVVPAQAAVPVSASDNTKEILPPRPKSKPKQQTTPGEPRRPAANHPWRRMPVGRARYAPTTKQPDAKS